MDLPTQHAGPGEGTPVVRRLDRRTCSQVWTPAARTTQTHRQGLHPTPHPPALLTPGGPKQPSTRGGRGQASSQSAVTAPGGAEGQHLRPHTWPLCTAWGGKGHMGKNGDRCGGSEVAPVRGWGNGPRVPSAGGRRGPWVGSGPRHV